MSNKRKKKYKELKKRIERERELSIIAQKMERKKQLTVSTLFYSVLHPCQDLFLLHEMGYR